MSFARVEPILCDEVRGLCRRPYPNHPRGCPNWGKRGSCPPKAKRFKDVFELGEVFAIWTTFPFGEHVERMRQKHPDWSERQLACCLYWQGTARKNLNAEIKRFLIGNPIMVVTRCPEAMGVDVTKTMLLGACERLEWPPRTVTYQVAMAGRAKV